MENFLHLESVDCENFRKWSGWFLSRIFGEEKEKKKKKIEEKEGHRKEQTRFVLEYFRHNVQLRGNERAVYFTLVLIVFARLVSTPSLPANIARGAFYRQPFPMCLLRAFSYTIPKIHNLYQKLSLRGWWAWSGS